MKKLTIAAAIVCVAALSQAASIGWGSSAETFLVDSAGNMATTDLGYNYVLVCLGATEDYANAKIRGSAGEFTYDTEYGEWNFISGGYDLVKGTDVSGQWYAIMAEDKTTGDLAKLVYTSGDNAGNAIETYQLTWNGESYDTPAGFEVGFNGNFKVESVPEPTSGLLLLLGVAGLALRRRRA